MTLTISYWTEAETFTALLLLMVRCEERGDRTYQLVIWRRFSAPHVRAVVSQSALLLQLAGSLARHYWGRRHTPSIIYRTGTRLLKSFIWFKVSSIFLNHDPGFIKITLFLKENISNKTVSVTAVFTLQYTIYMDVFLNIFNQIMDDERIQDLLYVVS